MSDPHVLVIDTETTGVDTNLDSICQLAGVLTNHIGAVSRPETLFSSYCVPEAEMQKEAFDVHGITPDQYKWSPDEWTALATLDLLIKELQRNGEVILAGQNHMRFDLPLMDRLYPEAKFQEHPIIDTMVLVYRMFPGKPAKLGELYEWYIGKEAINAHDAAADCYMVSEILVKMVHELDMSLMDVAKWCVTPTPWTIMPFGKHKGMRIEDVPTGYLGWMKRNITDPSLDLEATINSVLGEPDE